jgi:hypothetical protein
MCSCNGLIIIITPPLSRAYNKNLSDTPSENGLGDQQPWLEAVIATPQTSGHDCIGLVFAVPLECRIDIEIRLEVEEVREGAPWGRKHLIS